MANFNPDLILVSSIGLRPWLSDSTIALAMENAGERLDCRIERLESDEASVGGEDSQSLDRLYQAMDRNPACPRIVLLPLGSPSVEASTVRTSAWFSKLNRDAEFFFAKPPTPREFGDWIGSIGFDAENTLSRIELVPPTGADDSSMESIVATAYWAQSSHEIDVLCRRAGVPTEKPRERAGYLPWSNEGYSVARGAIVHGAVRETVDGEVAWDWIRASVLADWMVQRYLQSVRGRPFPLWGDDPDAVDAVWPILSRIVERSENLLPSEYAGSLDSVSPTSMGSAQLRYDGNGKVPWDLIWTSFCDLAMAGGPPHRGKLLEAVTAEQVAVNPDCYAEVVQEIRRGIELASRLPTIESPVLGWVGVCCTSEPMAAWMLRAIVIENVMVRREGKVLFLPAGPDFRLEKEIKNVITTVAKTSHYWHAHLVTRQPPKPL